MQAKKINARVIEMDFIFACQNGDSEKIKSLIESVNWKEECFQKINLFEGMKIACERNDVNTLKAFFTSKTLERAGQYGLMWEMKDWKEQSLSMACIYGNLDAIKYLLTGVDFLEVGHAPTRLHWNEDQPFRWACRNGHVHVVEYLTSSMDLIKAGHTFADVHACNDDGFKQACIGNKKEVVKYLLSQDLVQRGYSPMSEETKEKGVKLACVHNKMDLIHGFVFEGHVKESKELIEFVELLQRPEVREWFRVKKEHDSLKSAFQDQDNVQDVKNDVNKKIRL